VPRARGRDGAGACSAAKRTDSSVIRHLAFPLRWLDSTVTEGHTMLMFSRSQLYIGLGLAAVVEIIIKVVAH
jgi:hypothetical protein